MESESVSDYFAKQGGMHMATINSYNSSSISTLFSGLGSSQNSYGIDFTTYNSIKNGSYSKLMKKYYSNISGNNTESTSNKSDKTQSADVQKNNAVRNRDNAAAVVDSASNFKSSELWPETDEAYKAVTDFVKNYNSLVSSTGDSTSRYILNTASTMVRYTKANSDLLKQIGISISSDNKLTVDEGKFKSADMAVARSVFTGAGSYGQTISAKASTIYGNAVSQLSELATKNSYTSDGLYSYVSGATYSQYT